MGHRRFVRTDNITDDQILKNINVALNLPEVVTSNEVEASAIEKMRKRGEIVTEPRFIHYKHDNYLKESLFPFHAWAQKIMKWVIVFIMQGIILYLF